MKIRDFKTRDIKTINTDDLRIILNTSFNKKIIKDIQQELIKRDNPKT